MFVLLHSKWICQRNKGLKITCNKETNKTISSDILDILARRIQQYELDSSVFALLFTEISVVRGTEISVVWDTETVASLQKFL